MVRGLIALLPVFKFGVRKVAWMVMAEDCEVSGAVVCVVLMKNVVVCAGVWIIGCSKACNQCVMRETWCRAGIVNVIRHPMHIHLFVPAP